MCWCRVHRPQMTCISQVRPTNTYIVLKTHDWNSDHFSYLLFVWETWHIGHTVDVDVTEFFIQRDPLFFSTNANIGVASGGRHPFPGPPWQPRRPPASRPLGGSSFKIINKLGIYVVIICQLLFSSSWKGQDRKPSSYVYSNIISGEEYKDSTGEGREGREGLLMGLQYWFSILGDSNDQDVAAMLVEQTI